MKDLTAPPLPLTTCIYIIFALTSLFYPQFPLAIESRKIEKMIEEAKPPAEKAALFQERERILKQGKEYYFKFCVHCHGIKGKGDGRASYHLFPQPRELNQGIFKFHTTPTNTLPLDEDLIRTIKQGIPGTTMPAWGEVLDDGAIHSLMEFVKTFSSRFSMELPGRKISIGMEPPFDGLSIAHGKKLYQELRCGKCHGEDGGKEGELSETLKHFRDTPSFVYDLRRKNFYKSGSSGTDIYRTLATGLDGSPMNAYEHISDFERWNLIHFLQSRYSNQRIKPLSAVEKIISKRISIPITLHMKESVWNEVLATQISIHPVRARKNPITHLTIQSLHNKNKIAIRMQWKDPTPDSVLNSRYVDQGAIQFALGDADIEDSPFYGMGEKGKPVNIWHWQADIKQKIIQNDEPKQKTFAKLSNPIAGMFLNPFNESSVEEINSQGIGTLTVQPLKDQKVEGKGYWKNGRWSVVFIRDLQTFSKWDVDFMNKGQILLAFALWDGNKKDMNANKMVSFWQVLILR